ncbi:site-specific integrase [Paraburkholderia phymatum]|uniref:Site-specific integrase n=1 Tax=Paraburkholderia phymatum TaxID=148447 RepID=A0ACC6UE79_9BURK
MRPIDPLPRLLQEFFYTHMLEQRNLSAHTVRSYRDTWRLFLRFSATRRKRSVAALVLGELTAAMVGIDLHSNNAVVAIIDDHDHVLYRKRLVNDLQLVIAALAPHREELQGVVVESTFYGRPGIMHGLSVILRCDAQFLRMPGSASPTVDLA